MKKSFSIPQYSPYCCFSFRPGMSEINDSFLCVMVDMFWMRLDWMENSRYVCMLLGFGLRLAPKTPKVSLNTNLICCTYIYTHVQYVYIYTGFQMHPESRQNVEQEMVEQVCAFSFHPVARTRQYEKHLQTQETVDSSVHGLIARTKRRRKLWNGSWIVNFDWNCTLTDTVWQYELHSTIGFAVRKPQPINYCRTSQNPIRIVEVLALRVWIFEVHPALHGHQIHSPWVFDSQFSNILHPFSDVILTRLDHFGINSMIAGCYTPVMIHCRCYRMLAFVWTCSWALKSEETACWLGKVSWRLIVSVRIFQQDGKGLQSLASLKSAWFYLQWWAAKPLSVVSITSHWSTGLNGLNGMFMAPAWCNQDWWVDATWLRWSFTIPTFFSSAMKRPHNLVI